VWSKARRSRGRTLTPIGIIRSGIRGCRRAYQAASGEEGREKRKEGSSERRERERNGDGVEALLEKRTGRRSSNHDHVARAEGAALGLP